VKLAVDLQAAALSAFLAHDPRLLTFDEARRIAVSMAELLAVSRE